MNTPVINSFDHFLLWEQASRDAIMVKRVYIDMAGDVIAGLMLSQIIYWHLPNDQGQSRLRVYKDDCYWLAKGYGDWWDECRLTVDQARRALKILQDKGLVVTVLKHFNGVPTVHIRIDQEKFLEALSLFGLKPESIRDISRMGMGNNPNGSGLQPESYKQTLQQKLSTDSTATAEDPPEKPKRRNEAKRPAVAVLDFEDLEPLIGETLALSEQLHKAGLNQSDAERLARNKPDEARKQLEYLPFKKDLENQGAYLRRAIEDGYTAPKEYTEAKKQEQTKAKQQAQTEAKKIAEEQARQAKAEEEARILEQIENLPTGEKEAFETYLKQDMTKATTKFNLSPSIKATVEKSYETTEKRLEIFQAWQTEQKKQKVA
jgi:hypothetical protein